MVKINLLSSTVSSSRKNDYIKALDGVRGFAFLIVLVSHISNLYGYFFSGIGKMGVWLFFVLSSYLLTSYFLFDTKRITFPIEWINYLFRRLMRIIPLYYFVLFIYYLFDLIILDNTLLIKHYLMLAGDGHFWTIPTEIKYYLILPVTVIFIVFILKKRILLTILAYILFTVIHQFYFPASDSTINSFHITTYLPVFLSGSVTALIQSKLNKQTLSSSLKKCFDFGTIICILIIIVTMPKIWSQVFYMVDDTYFHKDFIFYGITFSSFILFLLNGTGKIKKIFEVKILVFFGRISFSGYLIHMLILALVKNTFSEWANSILLFISIVLIIISSLILYLLIEKPCSKVSLLKYRQYQSKRCKFK